LPELKVRVVNVVDLMRLQPRASTRTGVRRRVRLALHDDKPVIFAYHGYPWLIHRLTYRRTNHPEPPRPGYKEEGTTTTPFDMVMLNDMDRFHLVIDTIDRVPGLSGQAAHVRQAMVDERLRHARTPAKSGTTCPTRGTGRGRGWGARDDATEELRAARLITGTGDCARLVLGRPSTGARPRRPGRHRLGRASRARAAPGQRLQAGLLLLEEGEDVALGLVHDARASSSTSCCMAGDTGAPPGGGAPSWAASATASGPMASLIPHRPTMPRTICVRFWMSDSAPVVISPYTSCSAARPPSATLISP
jgi:hypothetical protein